MDTEQEKHALMNIDLSCMKIRNTKIHPNSHELFEYTQQLVSKEYGAEFKLSKDLAEANFYAFPLLKSFEIASCFLIFNTSGFLLDDHLDKFPNDYEIWTQYLKTRYFPGNGCLQKWWRLFLKVAQVVLTEDELDEVMEMFMLCISKTPEVNNIFKGKRVPTEKEFMDLRLIDIGVIHQFHFILVDAKVELNDDLKNDANWIGLNKQAIIYIALTNDLYSLKKEVRENTYKNNYVYIKMKNRNLTAQESVNRIVKEAEKREVMARVHGEKLKGRNDINISRYVDGILAIMPGVLYWSSICKRYNEHRENN